MRALNRILYLCGFKITISRISVFILLVLPLTATGQVAVTTSIDTTHGFIGDQFHLTISVDHPTDYAVRYPSDIKNLGDFAVQDTGTSPKSNETNITYTLAVYDTGQYVIPSLEIRVQPADTAAAQLTFHSDSIKVAILPIVPPNATDLKDIKPLMSIPRGIPWRWIIVALIALTFIAGASWFYRRRRSAEAEPEMTPAERRRAAHEIAHRRLHIIEQADYPSRGAMKQHFSEVSETIREYFENRYFIGALEMTTTEVLGALPTSMLSEEIMERIRELLLLSDLVKFAKYHASGEEAEKVLHLAYEIIDTTKIELSLETEQTNNATEEESLMNRRTVNKGEPR